jgi:transposase
MQHCPRCQSPGAWILADGRCKCKACGARYSSRSVWDSIRLADATKHRLLKAFVEGRSAYRQRFERGACVDSRERFNRLVRACCTLHESVAANALRFATCRPSKERPPGSSMRGWARAGSVLLVPLREIAGRVSVDGPSPRSAENLIAFLSQRVAVGGVHCIGDGTAFATLRVRRDYVVIGNPSYSALGAGLLDMFWTYARRRMQPLRTVARAFVHLHLGEMCYRFNHRSSDLAAELYQLLQSTDATQARALLNDVAALAQNEPHASPTRMTEPRATAQRAFDA